MFAYYLGEGLLQIDFWNNNVFQNSVAESPVATSLHRGGGLFVSTDLFMGAPPFAKYNIQGNFIVENVALSEGGGVFHSNYYAGNDPLDYPQIYNNTISANTLINPGTPAQGSGICFPANFLSAPQVKFRGDSNIVRLNDPASEEWYWECAGGGVSNSDPWIYSHIPQYFVTCASTPARGQLFGANCNFADPFLRATNDAHLREGSGCIDMADPVLALDITEDIDREPRYVDAAWAVGGVELDRGADEFVQFNFKRGDVSSDNAVNVADVVALANYLYSGGPFLNCEDAADANDDGAVNGADPVALATALFVPGGTIPPPGAICGQDPTPDPLDACQDGLYGSNPCAP